jgi:Flp pilus assembly protein TadD
LSTPDNDLEELGMVAYRNGEFDKCVETLKSVCTGAPGKWTARLYLAMAYTRLGQTRQATQEFKDINDFCPDPEIKQKAFAGLKAMTQMSSSQYPTRKSS